MSYRQTTKGYIGGEQQIAPVATLSPDKSTKWQF
jgi:hypothetical protein